MQDANSNPVAANPTTTQCPSIAFLIEYFRIDPETNKPLPDLCNISVILNLTTDKEQKKRFFKSNNIIFVYYKPSFSEVR